MKLPFSFSLKFVFRILLPGFVLSLGLFPITQTILKHFKLSIAIESSFFLSVIITGWVFIISDMPIYMIFEGRRYWPELIRNCLIKSENKRLKRLQKQITQFKNKNRRKYLEASVELRRFPMGEDGDYYVECPTRIGNLIASYKKTEV